MCNFSYYARFLAIFTHCGNSKTFTLGLMNMEMTMQVVDVMRGLLHRVPENRALPGNHTFSNPLYKKLVY